jgi:hypothetical protein
VLREILDLDRPSGGGLDRLGLAVDKASAAGAVLGAVMGMESPMATSCRAWDVDPVLVEVDRDEVASPSVSSDPQAVTATVAISSRAR